MQKSTMIAAAVLLGLSTVSYAAGVGNNQRSRSELTPDQLGYAERSTNDNDEKRSPFATHMGEYSLQFDKTESHIGPPDPGGVSRLREEPLIPGLGLKLTKPLYNDFWRFGGSRENEKD